MLGSMPGAHETTPLAIPEDMNSNAGPPLSDRVKSLDSSHLLISCSFIFQSKTEVRSNYSSARHCLGIPISFKREWKVPTLPKFSNDLLLCYLTSSRSRLILPALATVSLPECILLEAFAADAPSACSPPTSTWRPPFLQRDVCSHVTSSERTSSSVPSKTSHPPPGPRVTNIFAP